MSLPLLLSGVLVVSPTAGPGVDFTSLYAAVVLADDGDIVLVKPGTYAEVLPINDKSLTIVGDGATRPKVVTAQSGTNVLIEHIPAGSTVSLRELEVDGGKYGSDVGFAIGASVHVTSSSGSVLIEDCYVRGEMGALLVTNTSLVGIARSELVGTSKYLSGSSGVVGCALTTTAAFTTLHASTLLSGDGYYGHQSAYVYGVDAQPGASVGTGTLIVSRSTVTGGNGKGGQPGSGTSLCVWSLGECGLHAGFGQSQLPTVLDLQSTFQIGATGAVYLSCGAPPFQAAPVTAAAGVYTALGGAAPTLEASAVRREGESLHVALESAPGEFAAVLVATTVHPFAFASAAGMLVDPAAAILPLGTLSASGVTSVDATVQELGAGVEGVALYLQGVSIAPATFDARLSNVSVAVLVDASL